MKRLLIVAACGALMSLGCETQQPGERTANKPVIEEPRTNPGEATPGAANRPDPTVPANPPDTPATK